MRKKIIIGSRGSDLALWQARHVRQQLKRIGILAEIRIIKTQGDKIQHLSFDKLEGKGFFTKEIEEALLRGDIDLAVHSHKDLPTESPKGLMIAAVSEREDPSELLLIRRKAVDETQKFYLKKKALVGTSSARRKSQLLAWRPDVRIKDLRGNVPTRIQKLRSKQYDAILIAFAGVNRLKIDLREFMVVKLDPEEYIPAPAQGVLALQIRENDIQLKNTLKKLHHPAVQQCIEIERKVLNLLEGGCQLPLGVYASRTQNKVGKSHISIHVSKADDWNKFPVYQQWTSQGKNIASRIVKSLRISANRKKTVFITREIKKDDFLFRGLIGNGYRAVFTSLIETRRIPYRSFPKTDWIFFTSKHGVHNFFGQKPKLSRQKLAAISPATADELQRLGYRVDFTGASGNTQETALQFRKHIGSSTVLFPQASEGLRTVQKKLSASKVFEIPVYQTMLRPRLSDRTSRADIIVFTSPSNVRSYLVKHTLKKSQQIISMGAATSSELKKNKCFNFKETPSYSDLGILKSILSV